MIQVRGLLLRVLLAIGLSATLWIYVTFSENPDTTATYQELPIRVEGKAPELVLVDERGLPLPAGALPTKLERVVVQADAQTLGGLGRSDIDAYVDLTGLVPGDYNRPVLTQSRRPDLRLRFLDTSPDFVPIRLEGQITTTVPLTLTVKGSVPFVYERGEAGLVGTDANRSTAEVSGPEGLVRQVVQVRAEANIEGLTASFDSSLDLEPLDAAGQQVEGVAVVPAQVTVNIPIQPSVGLKSVAVTAPPVLGAPASGYQVSGIRITPPFVNITGSSESLAAVGSMTTQPIDITNIKANLTREVALQVPEGVSLVAEAPRRVLVTIEVSPVSQSLSFSSPIPVEVVNVGASLVLRSAAPATLLLTLEGDAAAGDNLDLSAARAVVDVASLGPGTYNLRPVLELPPGVRVVGEVPEVAITLVAPTPQPRPTTPPAPPPTEAPTGAAQPTAVPATAAPSAEPSPTALPATPTPAPSATAPPAIAVPTPTRGTPEPTETP